MSLSNPRLKNPASKFISWSGSKGKFFYYDSEKGEKGENVFFDKPIYVVPLDEMATIKGFHDKSQRNMHLYSFIYVLKILHLFYTFLPKLSSILIFIIFIRKIILRHIKKFISSHSASIVF